MFALMVFGSKPCDVSMPCLVLSWPFAPTQLIRSSKPIQLSLKNHPSITRLILDPDVNNNGGQFNHVSIE